MSNLLRDIQEFFKLNTESNRLKKLKDPLNDSIKDQIKVSYAVPDGESVTVISGDVQAIYQSIEKVDVNQAMLMEILREKGFTQAIKTIEVVDPLIVEQLVYNGELNPVELEPCNQKGYTVKLTVKLTEEAAKRAKEDAKKKKKEGANNEDKGVFNELRNQLRRPSEDVAQDRF